MAVDDTLRSSAPPNRPLLKPLPPDHKGPARMGFAVLRRHRMLVAAFACVVGLAAAYTAYRWNSDASGVPVLVAATLKKHADRRARRRAALWPASVFRRRVAASATEEPVTRSERELISS